MIRANKSKERTGIKNEMRISFRLNLEDITCVGKSLITLQSSLGFTARAGGSVNLSLSQNYRLNRHMTNDPVPGRTAIDTKVLHCATLCIAFSM